MIDNVNHPQHYEKHKIILEPIDVIETMPFIVANVFKYVIRARVKGNELEDLRKARWYIGRVIGHKDPEFHKYANRVWAFAHSDNRWLQAFAHDVAVDGTPDGLIAAWYALDGAITMRINEITSDR